jgi:D-amino peptidase
MNSFARNQDIMNHGKKVMVRCDMEGLTGVVSYEQVIPGRAEYSYGQAMLMGDLLALIDGLRSGGCEQIVLYDEHFEGRNVDVARLPKGVAAICGKPPYRPDWAGGLDESFAGLVLLGLHSRSGTPNGLLNHTYEHDIRELVLNDVIVGEIGMEAAIGGDYDVPLWLVVGDSAAIAEAQSLIPGSLGIAVKESMSLTGAVCYPLVETTAQIRAAAEQLLRSPPAVRPYRLAGEAHLQITLNSGAYLDVFRELFGNRMADDHTLVLEGKNATSVWAGYWQMKLACHAQPGLSAHSDLEHGTSTSRQRRRSNNRHAKQKASP